MKKRVIILIAIITIAIISVLIINKSFIEDSEDYLKGVLEASKPQNISIFALPAIPILTIISPQNITYSTSVILLNYSAKNAENVWYSLDSIENITITSPLYINAAEGSHILYLYANNSQGTSVKSVTFSIKIEITPPSDGENGGGAGGGVAEKPKENITKLPETPINITEELPKIPENITRPEEKPETIKKITIKFLINLLLLVLLIIFVIILIITIKREKKSKKRKKIK